MNIKTVVGSLGNRLLCATCLSALWTSGALAQVADSRSAVGPQSPQAVLAPQQGATPEIIVTSSKRKEKLQDAALTVDVLPSSRIEALGIANFNDFASLVPSLNETGASAPGVGTVVIRGLYAGNFSTNATTATYIGETPITANGAISAAGLVNVDPDLLDLERIEVLKGPQGTLYGATSLGGIIQFVPKEPDPKAFGGQVRIDGVDIDGGGAGGGIRANVNIPVTDKAAVRVAIFSKDDPGFTTNIATGHHNLGTTHAEGGTAAAKLNITNNWDIELTGFYEYSRTRGFEFQSDAPGTGTPLYGPRTYSFPIDGGVVSQYSLIEAKTHYTTELGTLTGVVSRVHTSTLLTQDGTYNYGGLEAALLPPGFLPKGFNVYARNAPIADKTDVELRFASKRLGKFEFLGGFFFADEDTQYQVLIQNQSSPGHPLVFPGPFSFLGTVASLNTVSNYKEYSGFGNVTYYLTDNLDITGGLRYAYNQQVINEVMGVPSIVATPSESDDFSAGSLVYQASIRWRPSRDMSLYFRAASGYRPGGTQTLTGSAPGVQKQYSADTTETYEGGIKGKVLDHLTYDVDAYHTDWDAVHLTGLNGGIGYILNGGNATVDGAEAQLRWSDPSGLDLGFNAGLNYATLAQVSVAAATSLGAKAGDQLPGSPKWTTAITADYHRDLTSSIVGSVGATFRYQGGQNSSYPGALLDKNYQIPGYALLDVRASLDWQNYTARFLITNLADKNAVTGYYVSDVGTFTQPGLAYLSRPRTFSLSLSARF